MTALPEPGEDPGVPPDEDPAERPTDDPESNAIEPFAPEDPEAV